MLVGLEWVRGDNSTERASRMTRGDLAKHDIHNDTRRGAKLR